MKTKLLALAIIALSASAQTSASLRQIKGVPIPGATAGTLLLIDPSGKVQQVMIGGGIVFTKDVAGNLVINAVAAPPALATFLVSAMPLPMQPDGTAVLGAIGNVVSGSVSVFRNGLLQGAKDVTVDTNDPTKIKVAITKGFPVDLTDDWAVSYQRQ